MNLSAHKNRGAVHKHIAAADFLLHERGQLCHIRCFGGIALAEIEASLGNSRRVICQNRLRLISGAGGEDHLIPLGQKQLYDFTSHSGIAAGHNCPFHIDISFTVVMIHS